MAYVNSFGVESYKPIPRRSPAEDKSWIGDREYQVFQILLSKGLKRFFLRDLWKPLKITRRAAYSVVKRLVERGFVEKVSRGYYKLKVEPLEVLKRPVRKINSKTTRRQKDNNIVPHDTREPRLSDFVGFGSCGSSSSSSSGSGFVVVSGPFFDNVRGFRFGRWVGGDRGRVLGFGDLGFFDGVSYCEVLYRVGGFCVPGQFVVYTNSVQDGSDCVRLEWRPPRGFVGSNGVVGSVKMYWWVVLTVFKALFELLLREAPLEVVRGVLKFLYSRLPVLKFGV